MSDISWSAEDEEILLAANHEALMAESQSEIETLGKRLANLPVGPKEPNRERIGDAVLRTLRAEKRPQVIAEPTDDMRLSALAYCQTLDQPVFSIESPQQESPTIFSRANAGAGTLEVAARAGALNGVRYPGSDEGPFIPPFNQATASIGAAIAIPPHGSPIHGPAAVLDVRVELQIEEIWEHAPVVPGTAGHLIWTVAAGDGDLPLRGFALAWCRAGLTLVGAGGTRSRTAVEFVSGWVNRDGMDQEDRAPGGLVTLSHAVAISSELVIAGIFVDITCVAAAEESRVKESDSAYAELKCRSGDGYPVPSRLRLDPERVRVRLCEMPWLTALHWPLALSVEITHASSSRASSRRGVDPAPTRAHAASK
jgi:hypothetical protein